MKTVVIVQARTGSTRLPGKTLLPLAGKPVLQHVVERCREADVGPIHVAIGVGDKGLVRAALAGGATSWSQFGRDNDVFGRFRHVVSQAKPDAFLRITADCPLIEPAILRALVREMEATGLAYIDASKQAGFADGVGAEIVRTKPFLAIDPATLTAHEREHVTPYCRDRWGDRAGRLEGCLEYQTHWKLSLDTQDDYRDLCEIFDALGPDATALDALTYCREQAVGV